MSSSNTTYLTGDATEPVELPAIIAHICNTEGRWGAGFTGALSRKWRRPEMQYRSLRSRPLGTVDYCTISEETSQELLVANMVAQFGTRDAKNKKPLRYWALDECLARVAHLADYANASVHMPRIGCGLGGGKWEYVEKIVWVRLCLRGVRVFVYDLK